MISEKTKQDIAGAASDMLKAWNANESTVDSVMKYCVEKGIDFKWSFYMAASAFAKDKHMWCGSDN